VTRDGTCPEIGNSTQDRKEEDGTGQHQKNGGLDQESKDCGDGSTRGMD